MLVSVHISKQSPLTDCTGSLHQENAFISQLRLEYHTGELVASMEDGVSVGKSSDYALRLVLG